MMNSNNVKLEVQWSPAHSEHFITWGSDISLYEVSRLGGDSTKPSYINLSENTGAHLVASNNNYHYIKCVDICPQPKSDPLLALGQANGKVILTTFGPTTFDALGLNGKEFVPRHARQCNGVAWNPIDNNLLAGVLDKYRNDYCILLWDVMKSPTSSDSNLSPRLSQQYSNLTPAVELAKPLTETGLTELAHSLAWLHHQPRTLAVGMNQKQIKIFDLRDISNKSVSIVNTKSVFGICVDPFNDYQLASRSDNVINIWDRRMFDKPVLNLIQSKAVSKIAWCPTRQNLIASLQRDSTVLHLADLRGLGSEDDIEIGNENCRELPTALERSIVPGSTHILTSFSWHPTDTNRLLTISVPGTITDYTVCDRITLNWGSGSSPFVWSHGNTTLKILDDDCSMFSNDISVKIKQRAVADYGLKPDLSQNGDLVDDEQLKKLWNWLHISRSLVEDGCIRGSCSKHPGVKSALKLELPNTSSMGSTSCVSSVKTDFIGVNNIYNTIYRSEDRDKALQLCGWSFDKDSGSLNTFLDKLESEKAYSRAAAISVFNMKLRWAIDILNRGAEKSAQNAHLGIISMALSGYSETPGSMWRQLCSTPRYLNDPYIRAIFAFLTSENGSYDNVLNENGMSIEDRVAFACIFLSDSKLPEYIVQLTAKLIEDGNLSGMILTGTSSECVNLLQQYLDSTGDVQSVSLIAARTFQPELLKEPQVADWIASYRNLLDSWHFWTQRASFDITMCACNLSSKPSHQVYIFCNYCGKSVSAYMQGLPRSRNSFRSAPTSNKFKQMSACPNCRKPLPRCAICLLHMGTHGGPVTTMTAGGTGTITREYHKSSDFSSWFTWCQSCRHGGHALHLTQWFKEHTECPVSSCNCKCFSLDSISSQSFLQLCIS